MKNLPLKFFISSFFFLFFLFISKTPSWAQTCAATKNPDQSCSYVDNCNPMHMRTWETGAQTTACHCECVKCTDNSHCTVYGPNYICQNYDCMVPGAGSCQNFDSQGGLNQPGVTCNNNLIPLIEPKYVMGELDYYTCRCVECINANNCADQNMQCINNHCELPTTSGGVQPLDVWGPCGENVGVDTAIGCIPIDPSSFVQTFITLIIGLAGVIAFLLMVFAAIKIILAGGNPEKLQAGKEMLTSAIIGLILIIFSTVILELIGVHILQIPGFLEFK